MINKFFIFLFLILSHQIFALNYDTTKANISKGGRISLNFFEKKLNDFTDYADILDKEDTTLGLVENGCPPVGLDFEIYFGRIGRFRILFPLGYSYMQDIQKGKNKISLKALRHLLYTGVMYHYPNLCDSKYIGYGSINVCWNVYKCNFDLAEQVSTVHFRDYIQRGISYYINTGIIWSLRSNSGISLGLSFNGYSKSFTLTISLIAISKSGWF